MPSSDWLAGDPGTPAAFRLFANVYVWVLGRKPFYRWNQRMLNLAVRGMGVGNPASELIGREEDRFLRRLATIDDLKVFDVGAHIGDYARRLREVSPTAHIWCFEPHPETFKRLSEAAQRLGFTAVNAGLSDHAGTMPLYDYADSPGGGTAHATLQADVIESVHHGRSSAVEVDVVTVDSYMKANAISHLNLLKIDAEGHELAILRGASDAIASAAIDVVQFEFNEMNVMSRVFFKDFYDALPGFTFYRMVVDGLAPMGEYRPRTHELFILQNVVAIGDDLKFRSLLV